MDSLVGLAPTIIFLVFALAMALFARRRARAQAADAGEGGFAYFNYSTDHVFVEVSAVIDNTRGGTMNIGCAYKKALFTIEDIS